MLFLKSYLSKLAHENGKQSYDNITSLLEKDSNPKVFLDVGCYNGEMSKKWGEHLGAKEIWGIEVLDKAGQEAKKRGIKVYKEDLNFGWKIPSESVDVLVASQVIEHLWNTEKFIMEIYRVLRKGGYCVIATDNMADWPNIAALILGWQIFPLTNLSTKKLGIGNPFSLHKGEGDAGEGMPQHQRIFTIRALREFFELHNFKVEQVRGEGWFPLPNKVANWVLKIDSLHPASFEMKVRKI